MSAISVTLYSPATRVEKLGHCETYCSYHLRPLRNSSVLRYQFCGNHKILIRRHALSRALPFDLSPPPIDHEDDYLLVGF